MEPKALSSVEICQELARLVGKQIGEDPPSVTFCDEESADSCTIQFESGIRVSFSAPSTKFSIAFGHESAYCWQGGADRFQPMERYSKMFVEPTATVFCNYLELWKCRGTLSVK